MKKTVVLLLLMCLVLSGCVFPQDKVLNSLGDYSKLVYLSSGGFQDYTDYAKYKVEKPDMKNNPYFKQLNSGVFIYEFYGYIKNFEEWVRLTGGELAEGYDFDYTIVNESDYAYMYSNPDYREKYDCYNVYFYDAETNVVYYFHNNI